MKNIPVFISSGGTATLVLQEIPHSGKAFVILQTILPDSLKPLLQECCAFCVDSGAREVYVSYGKAPLPLTHCYDILILSARLPVQHPYHRISLIPLAEDNQNLFIEIYNKCFGKVSHALTYDKQQIKRIHAMGQRAFLALDPSGNCIGIGELHESELAAVAVLPEARGTGTDLTCTLLEQLDSNMVSLTVASDNERALAMYEKLDFHVKDIESSWYRIDISP